MGCGPDLPDLPDRPLHISCIIDHILEELDQLLYVVHYYIHVFTLALKSPRLNCIVVYEVNGIDGEELALEKNKRKLIGIIEKIASNCASNLCYYHFLIRNNNL